MSEFFNMPKLSFIVTSYNYAQYVKECIDSILAQSYKNIEIIVVDDHSHDKSVEIINNIINNNKTDVKIKLIAHKRNKGQLASIFDGILASSGEFISCVDSDDKVAPDYALTHIGIHLFNPIALTVCELYEIDEKSTLHSIVSPNLPQELTGQIIKDIKIKMNHLKNNNVIKILDKKKNFFGGWWWAPTSCGVFRKAAIMPFLAFDKFDNWRTCPDKLLFNFLHLTGGSIKIYEPLVAYRRHGMNAGGCGVVLGDTRYNSDEAKKRYLTNQINLYKDILEFFNSEKETLIKQYSRKHYLKMKREIYQSVPKLILHKLTH